MMIDHAGAAAEGGQETIVGAGSTGEELPVPSTICRDVQWLRVSRVLADTVHHHLILLPPGR